MFERFTDSARRVVVMAQEASRRLGHDYIGTGHLLVGLTDAPNIAAIFMSAGLAPTAIEDELRRRRATDPTMAAKGHIPFTAGVKRAFELSRLESQRLGHGQIGPAHLLLGLLDEQCLALEIVTALDVDHFELRAAAGIQAELDAAPPARPTSSTSGRAATPQPGRPAQPRAEAATPRGPLRCATPPPYHDYLQGLDWPTAVEMVDGFLASLPARRDEGIDVAPHLERYLRWLTREVHGLLAELEERGYGSD